MKSFVLSLQYGSLGFKSARNATVKQKRKKEGKNENNKNAHQTCDSTSFA